MREDFEVAANEIDRRLGLLVRCIFKSLHSVSGDVFGGAVSVCTGTGLRSTHAFYYYIIIIY